MESTSKTLLIEKKHFVSVAKQSKAKKNHLNIHLFYGRAKLFSKLTQI